MAKFAFIVEGTHGFADVFLGFSWGEGGLNNTAIYYVPTTTGGGFVNLVTKNPISIADGFPGLCGRRIFLDVMGTSFINSYVDIDFKIYSPTGNRPLYQINTTSVLVFGLCSNSFTINTDIKRGGTVGNIPASQFIAARMKLITRNDLPEAETVYETEDKPFCGYSRGARLRYLSGDCHL